MSPEPRTLLVVSTSGRAMAESAVRGGYRVTVLDAFCDQDTRSLGRCVPVPMGSQGLDEARVRAEAGRLAASGAPAGVVYGAGLEHSPETLSWMSERFGLLGNPPDVLERLGDPRERFDLLDRLGIPYPESRFEPPGPAESGWLVKETGSSGGLGVRYWRTGGRRPAGNHYFQRFVDGPVMSVLFIADGSGCSIIGANRLHSVRGGPGLPFLYAGAVSGAALTPALRERLELWCARLVTGLGLSGFNNLDFVLQGDGPRLLELNPRPSATLALYDHGCPGGWMRRHVQACLGRLPEMPFELDAEVRGNRVLYAGGNIRIPDGMRWPDWCHDRPADGARIAQGRPLCTVSASGPTMEHTERRLTERARRVFRLLGGGRPPGARR